MRLIDYLEEHDLSDEAFALLIGGITKHAVKKWRYRERVPDPVRLIRIEDVTKGAVTLRDWNVVVVAVEPEGAAV